MINPIVASLVAEHLQDLLRDAERERRWKLARTGSPATSRRFALGRRAAAALRSLRGTASGAGRSRPATT